MKPLPVHMPLFVNSVARPTLPSGWRETYILCVMLVSTQALMRLVARNAKPALEFQSRKRGFAFIARDHGSRMLLMLLWIWNLFHGALGDRFEYLFEAVTLHPLLCRHY